MLHGWGNNHFVYKKMLFYVSLETGLQTTWLISKAMNCCWIPIGLMYILCPHTQLLATAPAVSLTVPQLSLLLQHTAHASQSPQETGPACVAHRLHHLFWMFLWNDTCSCLSIWTSDKMPEIFTIGRPCLWMWQNLWENILWEDFSLQSVDHIYPVFALLVLTHFQLHKRWDLPVHFKLKRTFGNSQIRLSCNGSF